MPIRTRERPSHAAIYVRPALAARPPGHQCIGRPSEDHEELIAFGLYLDALELQNRLSDQPVMVGQQQPIQIWPEILEEPG